ncbi:MAG: adenylosuccinate lyase [Candidatus Omnitrophica bacterium]|nr:adenylosuccinate lyase [Candidatus Omnitrophota bacterium]MDD5352915.1 adenylosuccinate lyase [Candidatus Omnitrophota bacterium]MDD5550514.1 adenylosuccinate lyase [Candidatus Omnitrophota bacterium]
MIPRYTLPKMEKIWSEQNKFEKMLQIEILTIEALSKLNKIPKKSYLNIKKKAKFDIERIQELEAKTKHDIVAFINNISEHLGQDARYLHMGLTSNDILDTSLAIQMVEAIDIIIEDAKSLLEVLAKKAKKYKKTICVGRTHGIHAEPITFGLKFALWYDEMKRNLKRLEDAREAVRVGKLSGAVGTYAHIEPAVEKHVCDKLNLAASTSSTQVIPRDRHAQYVFALALVSATLDKITTEIRHLQKTEVLEAEESFSKDQKGSSAMPHKKNPITCERISGIARILKANAQAALDDVNLWHERDISHSSVERVILPDSTIILDYALQEAIKILDNLVVYPNNMILNLSKTNGLIFSQRILLELMRKGLSRPEAYNIVQRCSMVVWQTKRDFKEVLMHDSKVRRHLSNSEIESCFDINYYTRFVDKIYKEVGIN